MNPPPSQELSGSLNTTEHDISMRLFGCFLAEHTSEEAVQEHTSEEATVSGENLDEEVDVGSGGDPEHLIIEDEFLDSAEELREHFDSR